MPARKTRNWSTELEVIGLRFRWKKDGRESLARIVEKSSITGIRLVREPDNKWDENAVMVMLPARLMGGKQLGYLHRESAELLAPRLDNGSLTVFSAKLTWLDPSGDYPYNIGTLLVVFRDTPKPAKRENPATKGKTAKA